MGDWARSAGRWLGVGVLLGVAAVVAGAPAVAAANGAAVVLTKREAQRTAVRASAQTCRVVEWCRGYRVVSAPRCRRKSRRTVYCPIAFLTSDGHRCGGVVLVTRTRRGRVDQAMAVPFDCSLAVGGVTPSSPA